MELYTFRSWLWSNSWFVFYFIIDLCCDHSFPEGKFVFLTLSTWWCLSWWIVYKQFFLLVFLLPSPPWSWHILGTLSCFEAWMDFVIELECTICLPAWVLASCLLHVEVLLLIIQVLLAHAHESLKFSIGLQEANAFDDSVTGLFWIYKFPWFLCESLYFFTGILSVFSFFLPYLLRSFVSDLLSLILQSSDLVFEIFINLLILIFNILTN